MIAKNKALIAISLLTLSIGLWATWQSRASAFGSSAYPSDCITQGESVNCHRKGGDMLIYTHRRGFYGRSGRLESRGNRSFHGGGARGGK